MFMNLIDFVQVIALYYYYDARLPPNLASVLKLLFDNQNNNLVVGNV